MTIVATIIHRVAARRARASAWADFRATDERSWADIGVHRHQVEALALADRSRVAEIRVFRGKTSRMTGRANGRD